MSMLYVMVPAALALAVTALVAFIWAVKSGQFDDPHSHAYRMLFEDEPVTTKKSNTADIEADPTAASTEADSSESSPLREDRLGD
ncbi:cbb3-type cytochrome oxidase assembly protein CcoS [Aeoliella mucimassa]|uniref:Cytochrome oxidase maturation protein cbb3-type n=1 Tax=Aeoliella mucimassa TaxID=2527972 RepID=A0A518AM06_9BACT|nr:cbb3-type cytochrome oxidase assembly protein CcoS [Aeoliella mucimassa]QDU55751.1 Cytochrome oxidase maturation protein cbb3-type [Aeoliella mucimassa]